MDYTEIIIKIRKIIRSLNIESRNIQSEFGISIPQFLVLRFLSEQEDFKSNHANISQNLELNKSTISGILSRLEKKNYIARLPKAGDKRVTLVSLTSVGYKIVQNSPTLLHDHLSLKLKQLPEKDLKGINYSLDLLLKCFDIEDLHASPMLTLEDPIAASEDE